MLDQKVFGEKLRNHRKRLGMTQEEVAEKVGVSPQAISKWESGDCLPDCFNLKAISDVYNISADVLLETESDGDIDTVARKIEQLATEFIWASEKCDRENGNIHKELGDDLWQLWKGIYFAEESNFKKKVESQKRGNTRVIGSYGAKIWDDDGVACVIKSELLKGISPSDQNTLDVMTALCSEDGQRLILSLQCDHPTSKQDLIEKSKIGIPRLNELLLLFTENRIIEYEDCHSSVAGYLISSHCGVVAYMTIAAMYILNKKVYTASHHLKG